MNPWSQVTQMLTENIGNIVYPDNWKIYAAGTSNPRGVLIKFNNVYRCRTLGDKGRLYECPFTVHYSFNNGTGELKFRRVSLCHQTIKSGISNGIIRDEIIDKLGEITWK